jgi:hypothetical protein
MEACGTCLPSVRVKLKARRKAGDAMSSLSVGKDNCGTRMRLQHVPGAV